MGAARGILAILIVALAIPFIAAPVASADSFTKIFLEYQRTGRVDGCKYSAKELAEAQREVPNDIEQYAPDFPAALEAAAEQRASGQCSKSHSTAAPPVAATPTPPPTPPTSTGGTHTVRPAAPVAPTPTPNAAAPQPTPDPTIAPAAADQAIQTAARDARDGGASGTPAPIVVLAIVGGLLALIAAGWGAARWWAWEPRWLARARHAGAEAGWRADSLWGEFGDWVKLGR
jgi:hypothetical protein